MQVDRRLRKNSAQGFTLTVPALALVSMAAVFTACGGAVPSDALDPSAELNAPASEPRSHIALLADPNAGLTFAGTASYNAGTATLAIGLVAGDQVVIGRAATNNNITINGSIALGATVSNTNIINIAYSVGGPQALVLDYINGSFGLGNKNDSTYGTFINTQGNVNDTLAVRLPNPTPVSNANVTFAEVGADLNGDSQIDINFTKSGTGFIPTIIVELGAGNDTFSGAGGQFLSGNGTYSQAVGTTADSNTGALTALVVYGAAGNDNFTCGKGNDTLYGGAGNDGFSGGSGPGGAVSFWGGDGTDSVTFAARNANLTLALSGTAVSGQLGEAITIGTDIETLIGGGGDDTLSGSPVPGQKVTLNGGPGNDYFVQTGTSADSNDTVIGGAGTDTVNYLARSCNTNVTLEGSANDGCAGENDNIGIDVENVTTGTGSDYIIGSASDNVINGGTGTNYLSGGLGDDTFDQGSSALNTGSDTILGGTGDDVVDYSSRTAAVTVALNPNTGSGESNENDKIAIDVENAIGGAGGDTLSGNSDDNVLNGGPGSDTVTDCGGGSDIVLNVETFTGAGSSNCGIHIP